MAGDTLPGDRVESRTLRGERPYLASMTPAGLGPAISRYAVRAYESLVPQRIRIGLHNRQFVRHTARWEGIRGTARSVVRPVGGGVRMHLYGDSRLCEMLYFDQFEPDERRFIDAFLRPGDTFLDVGANAGLYTVAAAHIIGSK